MDVILARRIGLISSAMAVDMPTGIGSQLTCCHQLQGARLDKTPPWTAGPRVPTPLARIGRIGKMENALLTQL